VPEAAPVVDARPRCAVRAAFTEDDAVAPGPVLPAPYGGFTACDVLGAIFPDFDPATGKSTSDDQPVRVDGAETWVVGGRTLLAVTYYVGADADSTFICGGCRVTPHVAIVERGGSGRGSDRLALVANGPDPWHPDDSMLALFYGRAELVDDPELASRSLLGVRVPWSHGTPGDRAVLTLYALDAGRLHVVFEQDWYWHARGLSEKDDHVDTTMRFLPRPGARDDILLRMTESRCEYPSNADDAQLVCSEGKTVGNARYRFKGDRYQRVSGTTMPLPGVLHRLWKW
jgi:hypothetical protein